jgi:hypothetical protein
MSELIKFPYGPATTEVLTASGTQAIEAINTLTIVDGVTTEATGDRTIDLTLDSSLDTGSRITILSKTNGTESTIFGTNITGASIVGVAGKTKTVEAVFDGTIFKVVGTAGQID